MSRGPKPGEPDSLTRALEGAVRRAADRRSARDSAIVGLEGRPMEINPGTWLIVTDAEGHEHKMEALSRPERGRDFPIVWVRRPLTTGGHDRVPWPLESVRIAD